MFKTNIFLLLYFIFCSACGSVGDYQFSSDSVQPPSLCESCTVIKKVYVEHGGLYSRKYEITIKGDGRVNLKGGLQLQENFNEEWTVSKDELTSLITAFQKAGFFNLGDKYGSPVVDGASVTTTIALIDKEKTVERLTVSKSTSEEETLKELELLVNKITNAAPRIRKCCFSFYPNISDEDLP